jgi:hypothetical protein
MFCLFGPLGYADLKGEVHHEMAKALLSGGKFMTTMLNYVDIDLDSDMTYSIRQAEM